MKTQAASAKSRKMHSHSLVYDAKRTGSLYLMLLLPVAYIIIFAYIPMGGATIAFKDYRIKKGVWASPWVGFASTLKTSLLLP